MKLLIIMITCLSTSNAAAQCGGGFSDFLGGIKSEAIQRGYDTATIDRFLSGAAQDGSVIRADRAQGIFQLSFTEFARRLISANRLQTGAANAHKWKSTFDRIEREYGVSRGVLLAFWGLETDYGAVQGNFNTRNALLTLAHDCRRPELFRPQVFAALELYQRGDFDPARTTGAWAGEIGMVQMLPEDILRNGVDADGDGQVSLKTSPPDALTSGARMLRGLGWRPNEPWLQEVTVPSSLDWSKSGLGTQLPVSQWADAGVRPRASGLPSGNMSASLLLPMGRNGPAFLAYPNFRVFFEWNKSFTYVTTAAYFATRLEGAPIFDAGNPSPAFSGQQVQQLQQKLQARGHDVGGVDGILGAMTRDAVQKEQQRLGLPADAWPTAQLLNAL
ncbi:lytic murein transglycosylase [Qingshengfaniella alkalisoli]|uniref:Lytic murein transglycosylase n=1 Tax=Qingshengfaniella alkalisoli TaxID=2599296 RepID=A0A5B8IRX9_9RHOB|nr:lytic murein transglycosylase [Qingshengfaniella alkalisoli]QDY68173.1 lytic murein transglycosylase [Qingshengfaniella alkalisoli]